MKKTFENEYTMERKYFKEYVYNILCKNTLVLGLVLLLIGIIFICFIPSKNANIIFIASIIAFTSSISIPNIAIKGLEKTAKNLNNGTIEKTNIKFENNIVMDEGKAHLEFEYSQITKIQFTKNFIVLKISDQSAILVLKNGFTKGNEEDFLNFIKGKTNK